MKHFIYTIILLVDLVSFPIAANAQGQIARPQKTVQTSKPKERVNDINRQKTAQTPHPKKRANNTYSKKTSIQGYKPHDNSKLLISAPDGFCNGFGYVDLNLPSGTKWAVYNLGADSASESGNFYCWGDVYPKQNYSLQNSGAVKTNIETLEGDKRYDAATSLLNAPWHTPTKTQFHELIIHCKWIYGSYKFTNGYYVVGSNNKTIFLPCSGYKTGNNAYYSNQIGAYLSANRDYDRTWTYPSLTFNKERVRISIEYTGCGLSLRPVFN